MLNLSLLGTFLQTPEWKSLLQRLAIGLAEHWYADEFVNWAV